jgi:hypothetical protein
MTFREQFRRIDNRDRHVLEFGFLKEPSLSQEADEPEEHVYAQAKVAVRGVVQTIRSGGTNTPYSKYPDPQTMAEEIKELADILLAFGFSAEEIDACSRVII